jgi:hypothetical protein
VIAASTIACWVGGESRRETMLADVCIHFYRRTRGRIMPTETGGRRD